MTFGERLIKARENKGYKQNQFAEMLGITATRLNYWEKDKREPDVAMIKKISSLLNVSSDWLIGNVEYANNNVIFYDKKTVSTENESDNDKQKLLHNYENLNDTGKNKLLEYSDDLVQIKEYTKKEPCTNTPSVRAARSFGDKSKIDRNADIDEQRFIDAPENDIDM